MTAAPPQRPTGLGKWRVIAQASAALVRARVSLVTMSDQDVARLLMADAPSVPTGQLSDTDRRWLGHLAWAICGLAPRMPFRSDCLVRVLAARSALLRRGLPFEIAVQAGRPEREFTGHAYLQCHGIDMTGGATPGLTSLARVE